MSPNTIFTEMNGQKTVQTEKQTNIKKREQINKTSPTNPPCKKKISSVTIDQIFF